MTARGIAQRLVHRYTGFGAAHRVNVRLAAAVATGRDAHVVLWSTVSVAIARDNMERAAGWPFTSLNPVTPDAPR